MQVCGTKGRGFESLFSLGFYSLGVRTLSFQLRGGSSILPRNAMEGLLHLLTAIPIASGIMVISASNPVHSVIWLVVAFISAAVIFILLGVDYLALIILIIYAGALTILFLFVIMMLDLTDFEESDRSGCLLLGGAAGLTFLLETSINRSRLPLVETGICPDWDFMRLSNIEALGLFFLPLFWLLLF